MKKIVTPIYLALLFAFSLAAFWACEKNTETSSTDAVLAKPDLRKIIKVEDGVLAFQSFKDFENVHRYYFEHQEQMDELKQFSSGGFISAEAAFEAMEQETFQSEAQIEQYKDIAYWREKGGERQLDPIIRSPIYRKLYNHAGIVKVEDKILKWTLDYLYIAEERAWKDNRDITNLSGVQKLNSPYKNAVKERGEECLHVYMYKSGKQFKKMEGESFPEVIVERDIYGNFLFEYIGYYLETRNYERGFLGRWYTNKADSLGGTIGSLRFVNYDVSSTGRLYDCCRVGSNHFAVDDDEEGNCTVQ